VPRRQVLVRMLVQAGTHRGEATFALTEALPLGIHLLYHGAVSLMVNLLQQKPSLRLNAMPQKHGLACTC
jgi:hypothetical protein